MDTIKINFDNLQKANWSEQETEITSTQTEAHRNVPQHKKPTPKPKH